MSSVADYANRTIDVLAWRGGQSAGEVLLSQSLANELSSGEICTGIQKMAQRFLVHFFNELGSIKYQPASGTDFITSLRLGYVRDEASMQATFSLAELQARANMQAEELATDPADERFVSATLVSVTVVPGGANLTIQLKSRAETAEFIVPI